jgi:hypothetical protein
MAFFSVCGVADLDILAHLVFFHLLFAGALPTCRMLCRDRAISHFCCISVIF